MPPKHTELEDHHDSQSDPVFAADVDWLAWLADPSKDLVIDEDVAEEETNTRLITAACKLTYILYHNVHEKDNLSTILQAMNKGRPKAEKELTKNANKLQANWKTCIVNNFLLPHVKEIIRKWSVAHPYADFKKLSKDERHKLWAEAYDVAPEKMVIAMWKPLIGVLDLKNTFRMDLPAEDNTKMQALRQMLRKKYLFGCEHTYQYTVVIDRKPKVLEDWAAFASFSDCASYIVPFADLPISSKTRALATQQAPAKKTEVSAAMDNLKNASRNSTFDPADEDLVESTASDLTPTESHTLGKTTRLSTPQTMFVGPSPAALDHDETPATHTPGHSASLTSPPHADEGQQENTSPPTFFQDIIDRRPLDIDYDREGKMGYSSRSNFFAKKGAVSYFQTLPKPTTPPQISVTERERRFSDFFRIQGSSSVTTQVAAPAPSSAATSEPRIDMDSI